MDLFDVDSISDDQRVKKGEWTGIAASTGLTMYMQHPRSNFIVTFNYEIVDDGRFGSSGNGNGIPEAGETIALVLRVKNMGGGASEKTIVSLKNLSGETIFLEKGRAELENLSPQQIAETNFTFNVKESDSPIEFEIQIVDEIFRDGITNKVSIPNSANVSAYKAINIRCLRRI